MLRVLRMAADVGIDAYGSPTRTSPLERDPAGRLDATVHELGALAVYFVTGSAAEVERLGPAGRKYPLGGGGLASYTVPKPVAPGRPSPQAGRSQPTPLVPSVSHIGRSP